MNALGAWGFSETDNDETVMRVISVFFHSEAIAIDWNADAAEILLDITDDNWDRFQEWKDKVSSDQ